MTDEEQRLDKEDMDILDDLYKAYDDGYAKGKADAIDECIEALGNNIWDIAKLEQLKEQKNDRK